MAAAVEPRQPVNDACLRMTLAYIGLGANLGTAHGGPRSTLDAAIGDLALVPHTRIVAVSPYYQTAPVDASGPDYTNAVVALDTTLDAASLLAVCLSIEALHGRLRPALPDAKPAEKNPPRTLDLDLLLHGDSVINTPYLTLPHPRMHQRAFVLAPLNELAPGLIIPGHGRVSDCLETVGGQGFSRISQ